MNDTNKPRYLVWEPEAGETAEDASVFAAHWAEDAVEQWAMEYDIDESVIAAGTTVRVRVCDQDAYEEAKVEGSKVESAEYKVWGEFTVYYHVDKCDE